MLLLFVLGFLSLLSSICVADNYHRSWDGRVYSETKNNIYTHISTDTYSEIMSIDAIFDDFRGPLESGNVAITYNVAEAGLTYHGWRFARILRYDYTLKFSEDTARLNYQIEQNGSESIDPDQAYDLYIRGDHIRSRGFLVAKTFSVPRFPIQFKQPMVLDVTFSWMESTQYYEGTISAQANKGEVTEQLLIDFERELSQIADVDFSSFSDVVAAGEMAQEEAAALRALIETTALSADVDYSYYEPALREDEREGYQPLDATGSGFALGIQLFIQPTDRWLINLDVRDLYSRISWKNTGMTSGRIRVTDAALEAMDLVDQYLQEDIVNRFSGQDFNSINPEDPDDPETAATARLEDIQANQATYSITKGSFNQRLPVRLTLHNQYQTNDWLDVFLTYHHNPVIRYFSVGAQILEYFSVSVEPETKGLAIGISHPYATLKIRADDVDIEAAKRLSLSAGFRIPW